MSKQILLIEDDPDLAELISDYLTMNYYDVHHAGLGQGPFTPGRILDLSKGAAGKINCQLCTTTMKILSYGDGKYRKQ